VVPGPLHLGRLGDLHLPFSRPIWFIWLLLIVLTHAHLLHAGVLHLAHGLPRARRLRWMVRRCPCGWLLSGSGDDPPVYCVRDALVLYVLLSHLESRRGVDGRSTLPSFGESRISFFQSTLEFLVFAFLFSRSIAIIHTFGLLDCFRSHPKENFPCIISLFS